VRAQDLNADLAPYFNMKDAKGALVVEVMDDSPAKKAGIKAGDVIVQVGDESVSDTEGLVRALRDEEGDTKVTVLRKGQQMTMTPKLDTPEPMGYRAPMRMRGDSMTPDERQQMQDEMRRMRDQLREMQQRLDKLEKD
jgi:predicted metalloprotease with PDZ domain